MINLFYFINQFIIIQTLLLGNLNDSSMIIFGRWTINAKEIKSSSKSSTVKCFICPNVEFFTDGSGRVTNSSNTLEKFDWFLKKDTLFIENNSNFKVSIFRKKYYLITVINSNQIKLVSNDRIVSYFLSKKM